MPEGSYQLSPKECAVSPAELQNQAQVFDEMFSNICGRAATYNAVANTTATEFSDLIEGDIRGAADGNEEAWSSALLATVHAVGVINAYAQAVQTYKNTIETLEGDLADEIAAAETVAEKENLVAEYNGLAEAAWQALETEATAADDMLSDGPTPEHISALTEAGHIGGPPGGLGWVITGNDAYFGVTPDMDGSEVAETIQMAAEGDQAALDRLGENMALMSAFMAYVAGKQESGTQLTERELEILSELNAHLDDADPSESNGTGVSSYDNPVEEAGEFFTSIEEIKNSEHLTDAQKNEILALVGGAVLASSDESIGGNYSHLPESVTNTIEGPRIHSPSTSLNNSFSLDWAGDFEILTEVFDEAREKSQKETGYPLQGGAELSAISIGTIAGAVDSWASGAVDEEVLRTMMEFSMQNEDANYAILTGEYPSGESYEHPVEFNHSYGRSGTDNGELIASLFAHDWEDNGLAVSSLTEWISVDGASENETVKERADRALAGLFDVITDPEVAESLSNTEHSVDDVGPDNDDFTWKNAPMGLVNPEISGSFANIFESYVDEFASMEILNNQDALNPDVVTGYDAETGLIIDMSDRISFTSLIAGDAESMGRMYETAETYTFDSAYEYYSEPGAAEDSHSARRAGLLWNAVSNGMYEAVNTRFESHNTAIGEENETMGYAVDMIAAGIPDGRAAEPVKIFLKEMFTQDSLEDTGPANPQAMADNVSAQLDSTLKDAAIAVFYDSMSGGESDVYGSDAPEVPSEMINEDGEFIRDPNLWGTNGDGAALNLRDSTWDEVEDLDAPLKSEDDDMGSLFETFGDKVNLIMRISGSAN